MQSVGSIIHIGIQRLRRAALAFLCHNLCKRRQSWKRAKSVSAILTSASVRWAVDCVMGASGTVRDYPPVDFEARYFCPLLQML